MTRIVTWNDCGCGSSHRNTRDMVRCKYPRMSPAAINGAGNWVAATWCRPARLTIWLTREQAVNRVERYDDIACGANCVGPDKHHVAELRPKHKILERKKWIKPKGTRGPQI